MRQFTATEKQQLQSKIRDRHERWLKRPEKESPNAKYWLLAIILFAVAFNVIIFLIYRSFGADQLYLLVIMLMALFDYIASYFATRGWKKRLLKMVEWVFIVTTLAYVVYQVWLRFVAKPTVTLW